MLRDALGSLHVEQIPAVAAGIKLGAKLGFAEANGKYRSISMGQGQEINAEESLLQFSKEGGWLFLQNVHLMESWLPKLERQLELEEFSSLFHSVLTRPATAGEDQGEEAGRPGEAGEEGQPP